MNIMTNKLLPCPLCGGEVKSASRKGEGFLISCHCGVNYAGLCASSEDLHRNWNRRATSATPAPRVFLGHLLSNIDAHFDAFCGEDQLRDYLENLVIREASRKAPIAWLSQCKASGLFEQAEPEEKSSNPERWTDAFPVFREMPAPLSPDHSGGGAGMVLTDDQILEAMREHIYAADGGYVFDTAKDDVIAAGRALLDKVKELNQ